MAEKDFQDIIEREQGLEKNLSTGKISMIAIGGAIGTGLFLGSGMAIHLAGPGVIISYAIGALISLLLMGCLAEMTVAHPTSGSFGAIAEHYISPWAGFVVRYTYWACIVAAAGTEVTAVSIYMKYWFPGVPGWVWILLFSALLIGVNIRSVNLFGTVEYWFSMIKIIAIVAFIIVGAYTLFDPPHSSHIGFANYTSKGGFLPHGLSGMWMAVIVAFFSYISVEMIAVTAGEAKDPQKAVPRALKSMVFRLIIFYILTMIVMLGIVPWNKAGVEESPFVKVFQLIGLPAAGAVMNFVVLVAALSAMNSQLYISTRMMFSLSRAGFAPKRFGRISKTGVPVNALWTSSVGIAIATIVTVISPNKAYLVMMAIAIFGAIFTWLMIFVCHLFFRKKWGNRERRIKMWGYPYLTLLGVALMLAVLITTWFVPGFKMTLMVGIPWLVLVSLGYWVYRNRQNQPDNVEEKQAVGQK